jgi:polyhydroxyalkanoate synthesis repressor PhaR
VFDEAQMSPPPVVELRRYPSRKLYNKTESRYVRLPDVAELIRGGASIRVEDTETGEDVTRQVLLQIIMEQETQADRAILSSDLLTDMIRMNSTRASHLMTTLFEQSAAFMKAQQEQFTSHVANSMAQPWAVFDPQQLQELQRDYQKRLAAFWSASVQPPTSEPPREPEPPPAESSSGGDELAALRARLETLERKLSRR